MTDVTNFEVRDRVAYITLNRPQAMNALNPELRWALSRHFDEVETNDEIWLAVVTGAGDRAFCAGADLKHRALERAADDEQRATWARMQKETTPLNLRWHFPKPVIAKVNGFALGGGLELALSCDIVVAAEHAELGPTGTTPRVDSRRCRRTQITAPDRVKAGDGISANRSPYVGDPCVRTWAHQPGRCT